MQHIQLQDANFKNLILRILFKTKEQKNHDLNYKYNLDFETQIPIWLSFNKYTVMLLNAV